MMESDFRQISLLARKEIKNLVGENQLDQVSSLLRELAELCGGETTNEVVVLRRGISELDHVCRLGSLSFKESSEEKNRLANRLLAILENLARPV
jgi:hypothetical protein